MGRNYICISRNAKASDTPDDFIRRSPRSAKIARCALCSDCDFCRSPRRYLACQISEIKFAKCARSRDFQRLLLGIASKANSSGWAILSHEFQNYHIAAISEKIARCVRINRWRKSLTIFAGDQIRRDRRIISPGVSLA